MNAEYIHRFLTSLAFTCAVETAVIFALIVFLYRDRRLDARRIIFAGIFASFATIPYVWFVFHDLFPWPPAWAVWGAETFAFLVEALIYRMILEVSWRRALTLSFVANVASYVLGPILRNAGLWIYW